MDLPPLTVAEARAILRADETLDLTHEARLSAGTFGDQEREAWIRLVESARGRVELYDGLTWRLS